MPIDHLSLKQIINQEAELCVKCGMCSAHCPTYQISQNENESPRGRIALAQALVNDDLPADDAIKKHVDACLGCLACEKICPSKVQYGELIDATRALLNRHDRKLAGRIQAISRLSYRQWRVTGAVFRWSSRLGLSQLGAYLLAPRFRHYLRPTAAVPKVPAQTSKVNVFTGCLSNIFDQTTLSSLISLLNACRIQALLPGQQQCCGAIAKHQGLPQVADRCRAGNETVFADNGHAILFTTPACGAQLKHTAHRDPHSVFQRVIDAGRFLLERQEFQQLSFRPLKQRVLVHVPCAEKNALRQSSITSLIERLPGVKLSELPKDTPCCGAAGSYFLQHPGEAQAVRELSLEKIAAQSPDILVTSNYPCAMHLAAGLRQKGLDIAVMHPLSLLQQQLTQR